MAEYTSSNLPYAADAESPLRESELEVLRRQFEKEGEFVGVQTKFNYAWGLIKSTHRQDCLEGVRLLTGNYLQFFFFCINFSLLIVCTRNLSGKTQSTERMYLLHGSR